MMKSTLYDSRAMHWMEQVVRHLRSSTSAHRLLELLHTRTILSRDAVAIGKVLTAIATNVHSDTPLTWSVQRVVRTVSGVTVILVGPRGASPLAVVKMAHTAPAQESLHRRSAALRSLHADARLGKLRTLAQRVLAEGDIDGYAYLVEGIVPGIESAHLLGRPELRCSVQRAAAQIVADFFRLSPTPTVIDQALLSRWVDEPCATIQRAIDQARCMEPALAQHAISRLRSEVRAGLVGRKVTLSWVHGDFSPGNLFVSPDGLIVSGLVDWDAARPDGLAILDLMLFFLGVRRRLQRCELGDVMQALLKGGGWLPEQEALLAEAHVAQLCGEVDQRTLLLLCWMQHVAASLTKSARYMKHPLWLTRNAASVLACLCQSSNSNVVEKQLP
jgi:hypothetical protein